MIMDTGNDVSWVHCNSMAGSALFNPSNSTTYTLFSCDFVACTQLGMEGNNCSNSQCQYMVPGPSPEICGPRTKIEIGP